MLRQCIQLTFNIWKQLYGPTKTFDWKIQLWCLPSSRWKERIPVTRKTKCWQVWSESLLHPWWKICPKSSETGSFVCLHMIEPEKWHLTWGCSFNHGACLFREPLCIHWKDSGDGAVADHGKWFYTCPQKCWWCGIPGMNRLAWFQCSGTAFSARCLVMIPPCTDQWIVRTERPAKWVLWFQVKQIAIYHRLK